MMRALASAAWLACGACAAQTCGERLAAPVHSTESPRYVVAYSTLPARIHVGGHFTVDFAICPRDGAPMPDSVRVDASMPAHRHGMNYRAGITPTGSGTWRAEGMLFHMAGHWEIAFDLVTGSTVERLTDGIDLD